LFNIPFLLIKQVFEFTYYVVCIVWNRKGGFICKVCLAVDKLFRKHFKASGFNKGSPIRVLGRIIDRVSWIFRSTDWNNDGRTDNIGLDYDPQMQFWSYAGDDDVTGNEQVNQTDMETMLSTLSKKDFSDCCLGVAFTMKAFPGIAFGFSSQTGAGASAGMENTKLKYSKL